MVINSNNPARSLFFPFVLLYWPNKGWAIAHPLCYQCRNSLEVLRKPFFLTLLFSKPVHSFNQLNLTLGIQGQALSIRELTVWLRRWVNTSKIKIAWISAREACLEHSGGHSRHLWGDPAMGRGSLRWPSPPHTHTEKVAFELSSC